MKLHLLTLIAAVLSFAANAALAENVNVYSGRHYDTDLALYDQFTKETGIKVNLIEGKADELIERVANEGQFSPADVLITVDAGRLWRAEERGLFQPIQSEILSSRIPSHLQHPEGKWFGLSKRARVIIYRAAAGLPEGLSSYEDLAKPEFKGLVCVRTSSNIYNLSLMASIIERAGEAEAETWAKAVVDNFARPPQGNDTSQIRAVASGECELSIVNTYYVARFLGSEDEKLRKTAENVGVLFPNQETTGTHVNISGAGVLTHAPNRENAIKFIEFLSSDYAQKILAEGNNEYPAVASVAVSGPVASLGDFEEDQVNANVLGVNQPLAVKVFDRAGWK